MRCWNAKVLQSAGESYTSRGVVDVDVQLLTPRSYVQARGGSNCLLVPRLLNFFETQINVTRNCVKRKKYGRKSRTNLLLCAISSTIGCANFGPDWPLLFKVHEI